MGISYRRRVRVKRGRTDRFLRLMLAYSEFVRTHSPDCDVYLEPRGNDGREFIFVEQYPNEAAAGRLRAASCFDELWLPVIMTLVAQVQVRVRNHADVRERLP
jgi:hypothetical protein